VRAPREPDFRARWAALVAIAGGLVGVLAFPRFGIWPAAFISVALLSVAVAGRRARTGAWLGYLYGLAFLLPLVHWTGVYVGPIPWLLLGAGFAVFFAVLGAALPVLARLPGPPLWAGAAWVLEEALRDRIPFGGFPWGRLAFSQAESPVRWFAPLGGAPLVTFVVAAGGAGLAHAYLTLIRFPSLRAHISGTGMGRSRGEARWVAGGLAIALGVPLLGALLAWPLNPGDGGPQQTIAVIQGGLPDLGLRFESRAEQVLDNHVRQTLKLAREVHAGTVPRPSLVLWPEDSSDVDPFHSPTAYAKIQRAVHAVGVPILVGAILNGPGPTHRRNVGILWSPTTGPGAEYVKRHPVPFGEYVPLRGLAQWISSDAKTVTRDMIGGHGNGLLRGGPFLIGDVICFEVAYDSLVQSSVAAGARLVVVQTNNATFGHTAETYQQLAMSQFRAVETGRTVVQAATTGLSAIIGPDGTVLAHSGALYSAAILVDRVPVRSGTTLAVRLGAWPEYLLTALAIAGLVWVVVSDRRRRQAEPSMSVPEEPAQEMVST
jgi:apolipoprotein N-acyltransferase